MYKFIIKYLCHIDWLLKCGVPLNTETIIVYANNKEEAKEKVKEVVNEEVIIKWEESIIEECFMENVKEIEKRVVKEFAEKIKTKFDNKPIGINCIEVNEILDAINEEIKNG